MTHLSLFTGIGGLDLAAEAVGFRTVGQCEWADYPTKILEKHWPNVPRWRDIRTLTGSDFYERTGLRTVDVISGGFPCQPFSTAGKRKGKDDDRYLWPEMLRVIKELRPAWVVGENVAGLASLALDQVLADLEAAGYQTRAFMVPACGVNAPHRRYRFAIVAHCDGLRRDVRELSGERIQREKPACDEIDSGDKNVADAQCVGWRENGTHPDFDEKWNDSAQEQSGRTKLCAAQSGGGTVSDAKSEGLQGHCISAAEQTGGHGKRQLSAEDRQDVGDPERQQRDRAMPAWGRRDGFTDPGWWDTEPDVGRVADGIPARMDRLKCLGNAVVPAQFYPIFLAIADIERSKQWIKR